MLIFFDDSINQGKSIEEALFLLRSAGLFAFATTIRQEAVIALDHDVSDALSEKISRLLGFLRVVKQETKFPLAARRPSWEKTVIRVGDVNVGGSEIVLMAGPCAIESAEQLSCITRAIVPCGANIVRGSVYKPRSSPYSFLGLEVAGLQIHQAIQKEHGCPIETEVMDPRDVEKIAMQVDLLRVGARNMQNFPLLKELGKAGKPVLLKRGFGSTLQEFLLSAEYIMTHGNPDVILCERGIRSFEQSTRFTLDLNSLVLAKELTHLPIIVDPSHAAGKASLVSSLAKAAIAAGADGLLLEVHHEPQHALSDGRQAILPEDFRKLTEELSLLANALGRSLAPSRRGALCPA